MAMSTVEVDAQPVPSPLNGVTSLPEPILDRVLKTLTLDDYRSMLFLLIDVKIDKEEFLCLVKKEEKILKNKFINIYYSFRSRELLLIEIFGTMQKYNLLKLLGTCSHIFKKDKDTFTQLSSLWKFLYSVCEQLEDGEVEYLKEKLFYEIENLNILCAEELICLAFLKGKLKESNWQNAFADILKSFHPDCAKLVASYKGSNMNYYPLRRPSKKTHCGIAVIMNHVKFDKPGIPARPESVTDANALKKLWESFGLKTEIYTDLKAEEVLQVFLELSRRNHTDYDIFVACYLSHGDAGVVIAKDGKAIKLDDLVDKIANHCRTLVGKPKLFFVQACQGQRIQTGFGGPTFTAQSLTQVEATRLTKNSALGLDVLIFNSSIEGFVSFRDGKGSWFIYELVFNMEQFGEELTVDNVLKKVVEKVSHKEGAIENSVSNCKQTPIRHSTLQYELKLKRVV